MSEWSDALSLWKRTHFARAEPIPVGSIETCFVDRLAGSGNGRAESVDDLSIASGKGHAAKRDDALPIFSTVFISA